MNANQDTQPTQEVQQQLIQEQKKKPKTRKEDKPFKCVGYGNCTMEFSRSEHLARHERKHTGERPYSCEVQGCIRRFSRYDNMVQHMSTHNKPKKNARNKMPATTTTTAAAEMPATTSVAAEMPTTTTTTAAAAAAKGKRAAQRKPKYQPKVKQQKHKEKQQEQQEGSEGYPSPTWSPSQMILPHLVPEQDSSAAGYMCCELPDSPPPDLMDASDHHHYYHRRAAPKILWVPHPSHHRRDTQHLEDLNRSSSPMTGLAQVATYLIENPGKTAESFLEHVQKKSHLRYLTLEELNNPQ